jgi:hypothetical protein
MPDNHPIYLGAVYTTQGTVTLTPGSPTVTGSGTLWATGSDDQQIPLDCWITFNTAGTWGRTTMETRSYFVTGVTNTTLTLSENYAGPGGSGKAYRAARVPLKVSQFAVWKERLFAVGAETNGVDANVIYWAGWPGAASPLSASDIADWLWWQPQAQIAVGLNEGAIQALVPLEDRLLIFLQNAVYELKGEPPIDAGIGSGDLELRRIVGGVGLTTYDAVAVDEAGQAVYFCAPDGLYRIVGRECQRIDRKIQDHELYQRGMDYCVIHNGIAYFTAARDDYRLTTAFDDIAKNPNLSIGYQDTAKQFNVIWALNLAAGGWNAFQCVQDVNGSLVPTYIPGLVGGLFTPFRGDLSQPDRLYAGRRGLTPLNDPTIPEQDRLRYVQTVVMPSPAFSDPSRKRIRRAIVEAEGSSGFPVALGHVTRAEQPAFQDAGGMTGTDGRTRYVAYGNGGPGASLVGMWAGRHSEIQRIPDAPYQAVSDYTLPDAKLYGLTFQAEGVIDALYAYGIGTNTAIELWTLSGSNLGALQRTASPYKTNGTWYGGSVPAFTLQAGVTYFIGVRGGNSQKIGLQGTGDYDLKVADGATGDPVTVQTAGANPLFRVVQTIGKNMTLTAIHAASIDYLPLPGRFR